MTKYIVKRLSASIPVVIGIATLVFLILHLVPGDPVAAMFNQQGMTQEQINIIRERLGLNDPLPVQYVKYLWNAAQGNLGQSVRGGLPVTELIAKQFPYTLELALWGMLMAIILGICFGIVAGLYHNSWFDNFVMVLSVGGVSIPGFWIGLMMIQLFSVRLNWLPSAGVGDWKNLIMPAIAIGLAEMAVIARMTRSNLIEVLGEDYVRTARAKGLHETAVVVRHALKNTLIPTITIMGVQIGRLLGGAVVMEMVFARPGIGNLVVKAIIDKDFPVAQGCVLVTALIYVLSNILVDISYAYLDPRVRLE
jgi:ABC-type dipeptide/oligopeptide/nickel transport system permease component